MSETEREQNHGISEELKAKHGVETLAELANVEDAFEEFRYPDADIAAEYFDSAEQSTDIEIEVTLGGLSGIVTGELGYEWTVTVDCSDTKRSLPTLARYELSPDGGYVSDTDGSTFRVTFLGLWNDRADLYERMRDVLEQAQSFDPPTHRWQAMQLEAEEKNLRAKKQGKELTGGESE